MLPFELTKDTPYLALSGELWSVFYEYFNRNWPCYKGFLLYNIVNHSDVVGASPVVAAPTTSSFSTLHLASMEWAKTIARQNEKHLSFEIWSLLY